MLAQDNRRIAGENARCFGRGGLASGDTPQLVIAVRPMTLQYSFELPDPTQYSESS